MQGLVNANANDGQVRCNFASGYGSPISFGGRAEKVTF
jgi:hypothetical protein